MHKKIIIICLIQLLMSLLLATNNWENLGLPSARITSLDMAKSDNSIMYAGTFSNGVFKTDNGGETWNQCSTDNLPIWSEVSPGYTSNGGWYWGDIHSVTAIGINPANQANVFIGTDKCGLFESENGGVSWVHHNVSLPDSIGISEISINPANSSNIILGTRSLFENGEGGLFISNNSGETWEYCETTPTPMILIYSIFRNPISPSEIYATGLGYTGPQIIKSTDSGESWVTLSYGKFIDIIVNPYNTSELYSIYHDNSGFQYLSYSGDGGETWSYENSDITIANSLFMDSGFNIYCAEGWGYYDFAGELKKSSDFGDSWETLPQVYEGKSISLKNLCVSKSDDPDNLYIGSYQGIHKTVDGGHEFTTKNYGLNNSFIKDIEISNSHNNQIYACGNQGLFRSYDYGESWEQLNFLQLYDLAIDPIDPEIIYLGVKNGLYKSTDGGITYDYMIGGTVVDKIKIDPFNNEIVYCSRTGETNALYKSEDGGENWTYTVSSVGVSPEIVIDPNNSENIFYGTNRSYDGGLTWISIDGNYRILQINPSNSDVLVALKYGALYISYDSGNSFELLDTLTLYLDGSFYVNKFIFDENDPAKMYYAHLHDGLFYTDNSGDTWQPITGNYDVRVTDILYENNTFFAAIRGEGIYMSEDFEVSSYNNEINKPMLIDITNYPNPFNPSTEISFQVSDVSAQDVSAQDVKIEIYNIKGRISKQWSVTLSLSKGGKPNQ